MHVGTAARPVNVLSCHGKAGVHQERVGEGVLDHVGPEDVVNHAVPERPRGVGRVSVVGVDPEEPHLEVIALHGDELGLLNRSQSSSASGSRRNNS